MSFMARLKSMGTGDRNTPAISLPAGTSQTIYLPPDSNHFTISNASGGATSINLIYGDSTTDIKEDRTVTFYMTGSGSIDFLNNTATTTIGQIATAGGGNLSMGPGYNLVLRQASDGTWKDTSFYSGF